MRSARTVAAKLTIPIAVLQGQRDLLTVSKLLLTELTPLVGAQHGTFYIADSTDEPTLKLLDAYAADAGHTVKQFRMGQGLVGQVTSVTAHTANAAKVSTMCRSSAV